MSERPGLIRCPASPYSGWQAGDGNAAELTGDEVKAVILAGGYGSRLSEETTIRPKPMVEIGGRPILWHIMKIYEANGISDFVICCGYKGYMIKEYFADYFIYASDLRFDLASNRMEILNHNTETWTVTLVDTGLETATGGRLKRARPYIGDETFCFTYGDGLTDVNIREVIAFHQREQALVTLTAVQPPARFGALDFDAGGRRVRRFTEKKAGSESWVNGGFFVVEPSAIDYIEQDGQMWEQAPLAQIAQEGQLAVYRHHGFWRCMDHLSDKVQLESLWESGVPPWKVWG